MIKFRLNNKYLAICAFMISVLFFLSYFADTSFALDTNENTSYRGNELLIKLKNNPQLFKFEFEDSADLEGIINAYKNRQEVEFVEYNYTLKASAFPNDPDYPKQEYLPAISAKNAWSEELVYKETRQIKESVIAILDTGVDINHPDLQPNIWRNNGEIANDGIDNDRNGYIDDINGWDFVNDEADPKPKFESGYVADGINHGTLVAGVVAAIGHNNIGITGVSWKAKIMPLRILDSQGNGNVYSVYQAVNYAIEEKADIINMSFVGNEYSQALHDVLKNAYDRGVVVIAAAGNTDPNSDGVNMENNKMYPVCLDDSSQENFVIGVASLGYDKKKSSFSNYGKNCIDISAPGERFFGTVVYDSNKSDFNTFYKGYYSGTSLSAPIISGAAALIKSLRPDLKNNVITEIILSSVDDIYPYNKEFLGQLGKGQLNLAQAVDKTIKYDQEIKKQFLTSQKIITGLGFGSFPQIKLYDTSYVVYKEFFAYAPNFKGEIYVTGGDVDNDKIAEVITGAGVGGGPHVRIFDQEGRVKGQFFAYDKNSRSGVMVALGDVDGDGANEIITSQGKGAMPEIKIFKPDGTLIRKFFAYSQNFYGGVSIAIGDIDGDNKSEIITGAGPGGGPHVRIFDYAGNLKGQFFAFNSNSRFGIRVAAGDVNGDRAIEVIVSLQQGSFPNVRVFRSNDYFQLSEFFAYSPNFTGGVDVAVSDIDSNGLGEIITGTGPGGGPHVKIFDWRGSLKGQFFAHNSNYTGGVRIGILK